MLDTLSFATTIPEKAAAWRITVPAGRRKQAQAGAERSQDGTDGYNGALMRRDQRLA